MPQRLQITGVALERRHIRPLQDQQDHHKDPDRREQSDPTNQRQREKHKKQAEDTRSPNITVNQHHSISQDPIAK